MRSGQHIEHSSPLRRPSLDAYIERYRIPIILVLGAVVFTLNLFPAPFYAGAEFTAGGAIVVAASIIFGPVTGMLLGLLGGIATYFPWANIYGLIPYALEGLIVGIAIRRRQNTTLIGCLYWLVIGAPLVGLLLYLTADYDVVTKQAITLKYAYNGFLTISLGSLIGLAIRYFAFSPVLARPALQSVFRNLVFLIVLMACFGANYFWMRTTIELKIDETTEKLALEAAADKSAVEAYIDGYKRMLSFAVKSNSNTADAEVWQRLLITFQRDNPAALTMLMADDRGKILAAAPAELLERINSATNNVSDRSYFKEPQKTGTGYVSDVFLGRGFGSDALVAISEPILVDGEFKGILEISLDLSRLSVLDAKSFHEDQGLIMLDRNNRVIYASGALGYKFMDDLTGSELINFLSTNDGYFFVNRLNQLLIARGAESKELGWTIATTLPRAVVENQIASFILTSIALMLVLVFVGFGITEYITRKALEPMRRLSKHLEAIQSPGDFEKLSIDSSATPVCRASASCLQYRQRGKGRARRLEPKA